MLIIRFLFAFMIFLQTTDCKDSNIETKENPAEMTQSKSDITVGKSKLNNIVVEHYGGMRGQRHVMIVTKASTSYSFKNMNNPKPLLQENETPTDLWLELSENFNAKEFADLKSGSSQVVYDGMDYVFTVKGEFGELKVTNPVDHNIEMKKFFESLKNMIQTYYEHTPQ